MFGMFTMPQAPREQFLGKISFSPHNSSARNIRPFHRWRNGGSEVKQRHQAKRKQRQGPRSSSLP